MTFTRQIHLDAAPSQALLHFSADTRYKLFVNGKRVAVGPSRGSTYIWYYDSLDIASYLHAGQNEIRFVILRYFAANRAAMPFGRTIFPGLTVSGTIETGSVAASFESRDVDSWQVEIIEDVDFPTGLADDVFLHIYERVGSAARRAVTTKAYGFRTLNGDLLPWRLQPRVIPMPEETSISVATVKRCKSSLPEEEWSLKLSNNFPIIIPADSTHAMDLQYAVHSTAFLKLVLKSEGHSKAEIKLTYSEGYELEPPSYPFARSKADRLDLEAGRIIGPYDHAILDLANGQETAFEPFWFRTFRIIRFEITAGPLPIELVRLEATQTNYPLAIKGQWKDFSDVQSEHMRDVSIRTLQNCMFDGYSDCPFYEQLQYSMDSRAVGLFHYLISGDDRLMRQAISIFASSTTSEGLPQSRFPSHVNQLIAGFPLYWILAVCDHHLYFGDTAFARSFLPRIDGVFEFFHRYTDTRGLVSGLPSDLWQFVDWVATWHSSDEHPDKGVPTSGRKTNCHTYFSMLLAYVLKQAAQLVRDVGRSGYAEEYETRADALCEAVRTHCYDGRYFTDSTSNVADELSYSQHCQVWAVLSGAAPKQDHVRLVTESFAESALMKFSKCSYMMRFYALRAFALAGDDIYNSFWPKSWEPWRNMLANNLTTWEEDDVRQRSDCHAWGSVPIYEYCTELAGVRPIAPGSSRILFRPRLTLSEHFEAKVALGRDNLASIAWKTDDGRRKVVELRLERAVHVVSQMPGDEEVDHGIVDALDFLHDDHA